MAEKPTSATWWSSSPAHAGAEALNKTQIGFTKTAAVGDEMANIKRMFTPEFRNRLDAIVSFAPLDKPVILRVVDKFLMQLEEQLHDKKVDARVGLEYRSRTTWPRTASIR